MKCTSLLIMALVIGIVCTPAASAGLFEDVKETLTNIKFYVGTDAEMVAPEYHSYSGTVINPENATESEPLGVLGGSLPSRDDYATFPANEYGKIVFKTENDPFTKQYQSDNYLYVLYGCNVQSSTQFTIRIHRDLYGTYEDFIIMEDQNTQAAVPFDFDINYYDADGDGIITIEVIHENTEPQLDFTYIEVLQSIDASIPEPDDYNTTETDTSSGSSVGSSSRIIASPVADEVPVNGTLSNMPIVTIPGFESIFALAGLIVVTWFVRREH